MSIRWKLTLWFALVLSVILIVSGIVLYLLLQTYLIRQVDDSLRVHSAEVHGTLNVSEIPEPVDYAVIHSKLPPINEFASPGIYIQFVSEDGTAVVKSSNLGGQELPVDTALIADGFSGNTAIKTLSAGGGASVRVMVSPLYVQNDILLLEVAQSLNYVDDTLREVRYALIASTLLALAFAAVSGAILVRRSLLPVRRISRTARTIESSSDLTKRVGYRGPNDEIGELATTFDHLIGHLDRAFKSQRSFVADASHELRGPLTVIRGNLSLLKRNLDAAAKATSLKAVEQEALRMSAIVDDLLLLAEVDAGQQTRREPVDLAAIFDEEIARARTIAGKRTIRAVRREDVTVEGDPVKLKELISNLVDNAIKYTAETDRIELSLSRKREWAVFEVTDTGIGIEPGEIPHIFDRFYRVDKVRSRASGGTGLGLAIVKGIVDQHGGEVSVKSTPGQGTTFTVRLKL